MQLTKKKGFTLIEIVIVLAIAALILVIVFLAVAGAQRSQRNEARRKVAGQFAAASGSVKANGVAAPTVVQLNNQIPTNDRTVGGITFGAALGAPAASGSTCNSTGTNVDVDTTNDIAGVCTETGGGAASGSYYRTHN